MFFKHWFIGLISGGGDPTKSKTGEIYKPKCTTKEKNFLTTQTIGGIYN